MSPPVLIVGLIAWGWLLYLFFAPRENPRDATRARRPDERRPGPLPPEVTRSFREPARLTNEALDTWPVLDEEPRQ